MCRRYDGLVFDKLKKQPLKVTVIYWLTILAFIFAVFLIFNDELKNVGLVIVIICQLINMFYIRKKLEDNDKH
ncbi:MAG: hypothetical protein IKS48_01080 [Eubacterium sp.]|nr:hypothetical protein [Eubacterium sp.]